MPATQHKQHEVIFQGTIAAQKRLASANLECLRISMWNNATGFIWEAVTNKGRRWVSYTDEGGWKISKEPPCRHRHARRAS
jgi:hypothetical protein